SVEVHRPMAGFEHPRQGTQRGRLPARVGTDDHSEGLIGDDDVEFARYDPSVIAEGQVGADEAGGRHGRLHGQRRSFRSRKARYVPPRAEVITPTGSSTGAITRCAARSATTSSAAPDRPEEAHATPGEAARRGARQGAARA